MGTQYSLCPFLRHSFLDFWIVLWTQWIFQRDMKCSYRIFLADGSHPYQLLSCNIYNNILLTIYLLRKRRVKFLVFIILRSSIFALLSLVPIPQILRLLARYWFTNLLLAVIRRALICPYLSQMKRRLRCLPTSNVPTKVPYEAVPP